MKTKSYTGSRLRALLWGAIVAAALIIQVIFHCMQTLGGKPYETWDELATFATSEVLVGPGYGRTFRYGTLSTFAQIVSTVGYNYLTMEGGGYYHLRYSNNVPASWEDNFLSHKEKSWPNADFNYFRGIDDRGPMFVSRLTYLGIAYSILASLLLFAFTRYQGNFIFVAAPSLVLFVSADFYQQAALSLPNAINGLFSFIVVLFSLLFAAEQRKIYIFVASIAFALAVNFKFDVLPVGGGIVLAVMLSAYKIGVPAALKIAVQCGFISGSVFFVTYPYLLLNPYQELRTNYIAFLAQVQVTQADASIVGNILQLSQFLDRCLLASWGGKWTLAFVLGVLSLFIARALIRRTYQNCVVATGAVITLVLWTLIAVGVTSPYDRYYINGLGAFFATISAFLLLRESNSLFASRLALAVLIVLYLGNVCLRDQQSFQIYDSVTKSEGLDPRHNRNKATLAAIKFVKSEGISGKVLVDQHAYVDLAAFRRAKLEPIYINMNSLENVVSSLTRGASYAVIFSNGDTATTTNRGWRWMEGEWTPDMKSKYRSYHGFLEKLPVLERFAGGQQRLLEVGPVNMYDEITVSVLRKN